VTRFSGFDHDLPKESLLFPAAPLAYTTTSGGGPTFGGDTIDRKNAFE
jgi:hypothetical protein